MKGKLVNSRTRLYAIIGDPISHTLSPVIMNYSFQKLGLDNVFVAMRCGPEEVDAVMKALRIIDLAGYVVTMPLKELVSPYLDDIRGEARISGAVNCIQNMDGKLIGYNTDAMGFWSAIQSVNSGSNAKPINKLFILGMGGLAKAVATEAAIHGVRNIVACNRLEEPKFIDSFRAFGEKLSMEFPGTRVALLPWEAEQWSSEAADSDVIMNVTPIGLDGKGTLHQIFPYHSVKSDIIFFDAPLSADITMFIQKAKSNGHRVLNGLDLIVHQGVYALKILTGKDIEIDEMYRGVLDFLSYSR